MKILVPICIIAIIFGCRKEQGYILLETPDTVSFLSSSEIIRYHLDTVAFRPIMLDKCNLELSEIFVGNTDGGQNTVWSVTLSFYDSLRTQNPNFFQFRFFDNNNNPASFGKKGTYLGSGWINDGLQDHTFSWGPVASSQMEYHLDKSLITSDLSHNFELQGKGYVKIKQPIYWKWPKCISNGEKLILPGDSLYLSYCTPVYYQPAIIIFNNIK